MKYFVIFLLLHNFLFNSVSQTCLPEGVSFRWQQEIDDFPSKYNGCTEILGDVFIYYTSITNLDSLVGLTSIDGELHIDHNDSLGNLSGLENLSTLGSDVFIYKNKLLSSISNLESLSSIDGSLNIYSNLKLTNLTGIDNLSTVTGSISIYQNYELNSLQAFDNLTSVGGDLLIHQNNALTTIPSFNNLSEIGGSLSIDKNNALTTIPSFNNLSEIGGSLAIYNNNALTTIPSFNNLSEVGGSLTIDNNNALTAIPSFNNLSEIGGRLTIDKNNALTTIPSFNILSEIGGRLAIYSNDALINVTGLGSLSAVGGGLVIEYNYKLESLSGLNSLSSIGSSLSVRGNAKLTNLDDLSSLTKIGGYLSIVDNSQLNSIAGIENIDPNSIKNVGAWGEDLIIVGNDELSSCEVKSICGLLGLPNRKYKIDDNDDGCNSIEEIECYNYRFGGTVYFDKNQNGQFDSNEYGIQNQAILVEPAGVTVMSRKDGGYSYWPQEGEYYKMSWIQDAGFILTSDSSYYIIDNFKNSNPENYKKDFGLYPQVFEHKGSINISSDLPRCNTEVDFYVSCQNLGGIDESGLIRVNYDPAATFVSASIPVVVDVNNHVLTIDYDTILAFMSKDFVLTFIMPDQSGAGEMLYFNGEFWSDVTGQDELLGGGEYTPIVLCSFDPNDKLAMPVGVRDEHFTLHDEKLNYTIRFQNTGNIAAIDITILDTLSEYLDQNSFRILNSSFPVETFIDGRVITFYFKNIWLPDSLHNEAGSHGFVTYEVKPLLGLDDFTEIKNTAYIIFDSNDAIVTNTTRNTMVTAVPVGVLDLSKEAIRIWPNPTSTLLHIDNRNIQTVRLYNAQGQLVLAQNSDLVDVSALPKGVYTVQVEFESSVSWGKILVN